MFSAAIVSASVVQAQTPNMPRGIGFGVAHQQGGDYGRMAVETLDPEVWMNWTFNEDCIADEYCTPVVFTMQRGPWGDYAIEVAQANPGRFIMLGNEPETDTTMFVEPAEAAAYARQFVSETDNPWGCCGVMLLREPGIEWGNGWAWDTWLDAYLEAGGPLPDVWQVHYYDAFVGRWHERLDVWRTWASERGITRPVIVAETGFPYGQPSYNALLVEAIGEALDSDPDLLAVYWYSVHDYHGIWHDTDLLDGDGALTPVGEAFMRVRAGVRPQREWQTWLPVTVKN